ncbi:hypothetical protein DSECCO2_65890 [anaerobic digester metagenome]
MAERVEATKKPRALDRGGYPREGGGDNGECERSEHEKLEEFRGGRPPSHLSVLKLASLALHTLRVVELRAFAPSVLMLPLWRPVAFRPSHSPSAPQRTSFFSCSCPSASRTPRVAISDVPAGTELEHRRCDIHGKPVHGQARPKERSMNPQHYLTRSR